MSVRQTTQLVFVQGKNLFDKTKMVENINISSTGEISSDVNSAMNYVRVESGVTYILSSNVNRQWVLSTSEVKPYLGQTGLTRTVSNGYSTTITIPSGHTYLFVRHYPSNSENNLTHNVQIEEGTSATTYQAYVEKRIQAKNSLGQFQEFYSEYDNEEPINPVIDISSLSGGATINSTYWRNRLIRVGKICHLELAFSPNSTNLITIYNLPAGFYSNGNTAAIGMVMRDSTIGKVVITNGGAVQVQVPNNSSNTWTLNATWLVD